MRSKFLIVSWSRDPLFEVQQPQNGQKLAIDSIAKIDQHKILSLFVHNKMGLGEKQIHTLYYGHVIHSLNVNNS